MDDQLFELFKHEISELKDMLREDIRELRAGFKEDIKDFRQELRIDQNDQNDRLTHLEKSHWKTAGQASIIAIIFGAVAQAIAAILK